MVIWIDSADDPRVCDYIGMKDRDLSRQGEKFIAESEFVVRRLLASDFEVLSVLVIDRKLEMIRELAKEGTTIYAMPPSVINTIVGFKFHSGVMAIGRKKRPPTLDELAARWGERATLVVCPRTVSTENLGAMVRIATAFGANGMILGEQSCDPFYRQAVRVSVGAVFKLPIVESAGLIGDLRRLRDEWGFEIIGTVLADDAESLAGVKRGKRSAILMGNESAGLSPEEISACTRKVTIPMSLGTDSLNVYVAAGIVMYHFTQLQHD